MSWKKCLIFFCARHYVSHWLHTDSSLVCTNGARRCVLDVFQQRHFQTPPIISVVIYSLSVVASNVWIQQCMRFISHAQENTPAKYPPFDYFIQAAFRVRILFEFHEWHVSGSMNSGPFPLPPESFPAFIAVSNAVLNKTQNDFCSWKQIYET